MRDLGGKVGPGVDKGLDERARALREYVEMPERIPILDYEAIRDFLTESWGVPVVEISEAARESEFLGPQIDSLGRCGVRVSNLFTPAMLYLAVRRGPSDGSLQMLWTLLHELGHFAHHFAILRAMGTIYLRLCLNPTLEDQIGSFVEEVGKEIAVEAELQADLFALNWLLPREAVEDVGGSTQGGLTRDGRRFLDVRRLLGADEVPTPLSPELVETINRYGREEMVRFRGSVGESGTRRARTAWLLWNRDRLESGSAMAELGRFASRYGRHVPEFTDPVVGPSAAVEISRPWLPRLLADEALGRVDQANWGPLIVAPPSLPSRYPNYNLPIRPVPTRSNIDRDAGWMHMFKGTTQRPRPLAEWIDRARREDAGLLLFPRNPAERRIDERGEPRP
ncbi:MAG TPA: hypothetical protein VHS74_05755 [Solirubrobacterales bacterium]|nr:hypothetical protein [Solirubrobacterales bacterium]